MIASAHVTDESKSEATGTYEETESKKCWYSCTTFHYQIPIPTVLYIYTIIYDYSIILVTENKSNFLRSKKSEGRFFICGGVCFFLLFPVLLVLMGLIGL